MFVFTFCLWNHHNPLDADGITKPVGIFLTVFGKCICFFEIFKCVIIIDTVLVIKDADDFKKSLLGRLK